MRNRRTIICLIAVQNFQKYLAWSASGYFESSRITTWAPKISPKSGRAVGTAGATGYERQLLALPAFLLEGGAASWDDILAGLRLTGHFLARDLLTDRRADVLAARERLVERLKRAVA